MLSSVRLRDYTQSYTQWRLRRRPREGAPWSRRRYETTIQRRQRSVKRLSDRDVPGVVRSEVVAQLPHSRSERLVGEQLGAQIQEVGVVERGAVGGDVIGQHRPSQDVRDHHRHQMWRDERPRRPTDPPPTYRHHRCRPTARPPRMHRRRASPSIRIAVRQDASADRWLAVRCVRSRTRSMSANLSPAGEPPPTQIVSTTFPVVRRARMSSWARRASSSG
jgi:hypothetical protein